MKAAALLAVALTSSALAQAPAPAARATRHALVIGIGEYADPELPVLRGMPLDIASAKRMAQAMAIPDANITVLRDRAATAAGIREAIAQLGSRVQDGDRVFVYYSGHGTRWHDPVLKAEGCTEGLMTADGAVISNIELGTRLAPLARRADKLLVFYDACFSGGLAESPLRTRSLVKTAGATITPKFVRGQAPDACGEPANFRTRSLPALLQQRSAVPENVVQVAASRPDEVSFDSSATGGFATAAWRDCLLGEARDLDGSGAITVDEVTQCAQAQLDRALAGVPGVRGQQMTMVGNTKFVPTWGAAKASARSATPAEILAELHGQRDGQRRVVATTRQGTLKIGRDALEIDVTPARDGHLYVALAGSDGQSLVLLYPNDLATDNRVRAGQRVALPGPGWEVVAGGPPGTETLLVMVTDAPRDISGLGREKAGPFVKTLLDTEGRAKLQAVLAGGTPGRDCGQVGKPPCSDAFGAALLKVESVR